MGGNISIMKIAGIPIVLNPSWFFIFGLLTWTFAVQVFPAERPGLGVGWYALAGLATVLGFFACLVLHELAHALVARRFGQEVRRITLFIFGGVSEAVDEMPSPAAEFWIAVAGPLTSAAVGAGFVLLAGLAPAGILQSALSWLGVINLTLAAFNLVPGFPLDGGRLVRAGVWAWSGDYRKATRWASYGGQVCGLGMVMLGILRMLGGQWLPGLWILMIGWLLMDGARAAYGEVVLRQALHRLTVADLMSPEVVSLAPDLTIVEAIERAFTRHDYHAYPVVQDGRLVGLLEAAQVEAVPPERWGSTRVADVMQRDLPVLAPEQLADEAMDRLARTERGRLPVMRGGDVVGMLSASDIARRVAWGQRAGRGG